MNADHKDALVLLAKKFARTESQEATITAVDRLGFHVRMKTRGWHPRCPHRLLAGGEQSGRDSESLVEMVQQARSQASESLHHLAHLIAQKPSKTAVCDWFIVSPLCDKRVCSCISSSAISRKKRSHKAQRRSQRREAGMLA